MIQVTRKTIFATGLLVLVSAAAILGQQYLQEPGLPEGLAAGNGRLEATAVDITTKLPGRLAEVSAREGDSVVVGEVLAQMDVRELEAARRQAQAGIRQAREQRNVVEAVILQRESEVALAEKNLARAGELYENRNISLEELQRTETAVQTASAALTAARAELAHAEAVIEAAVAQEETVRTRIDDSVLAAPIAGRVLYRLAEPGEVLASGGKVFTVLDLSDVFMTIFLPTAQAGRLRIGDEARIVLDAFPDYTFPANVTFVSPEAQFTPKAVETATEREKLMFRVTVRVDTDSLAERADLVKTGIPGVAYVRLDPNVAWPEQLQVRLPP